MAVNSDNTKPKFTESLIETSRKLPAKSNGQQIALNLIFFFNPMADTTYLKSNIVKFLLILSSGWTKVTFLKECRNLLWGPLKQFLPIYLLSPSELINIWLTNCWDVSAQLILISTMLNFLLKYSSCNPPTEYSIGLERHQTPTLSKFFTRYAMVKEHSSEILYTFHIFIMLKIQYE